MEKSALFEKLTDVFSQNILNVTKSQLDQYYEHWRLNFNELK